MIAVLDAIADLAWKFLYAMNCVLFVLGFFWLVGRGYQLCRLILPGTSKRYRKS